MNRKRKDDSTLSRKADAAFRQAAYKVIQRAKQTGTPVFICEEGEIKVVPKEELELRMHVKTLRDARV